MSLDRSLKAAGSLAKHRNVISRPERIARLAAKDNFDMSSGDPLGLPKVANRKAAAKKTVKKAEATAEGEAAVPSAAAPAAATSAPAGKAPAGKAPAGKAPAGKAGGKGGK